MEIRFNVFYIFMLIYWSLHSGGTASDNVSGKKCKRFCKRWSAEEEEKLIFFDVSTNDGEGNQLERIKALWHKEYPYSNLTDSALYQKLHNLRLESQEEGERTRYFKWNSKKKEELLDTHYKILQLKGDAKKNLEEEWKKRYKDCQLSQESLLDKVRKILYERRQRLRNPAEGISGADLEWDKQHDSDLIHAHNVAHLEGVSYIKDTHRIWSDLYPQFSHLAFDQLRERIKDIRDNPPNVYFPWTEQENEELLDIFYKTMPDVEDQGQRIYDIWSKIHPRYKFMTPYYLQIHASTLAHEREMQKADNPIRRGYTYEQKVDLVNLYHQHLGERPGYRGFHKEWVRKHPRRAYLTNSILKDRARQLEKKELIVASRNLREGLSHKGKGKYTSKSEQELHGEYGESSSKVRGHLKRPMRENRREQDARTSMKFGSMKKIMGQLKKQRSEKPHGKAPVVYSSDEQESPPSSMSED